MGRIPYSRTRPLTYHPYDVPADRRLSKKPNHRTIIPKKGILRPPPLQDVNSTSAPAPNNEASNDEAFNDEASNNEASNDEAFNNEASDSEASNNEPSNNGHSHNEAHNNEAHNNEAPNNEASNNEAVIHLNNRILREFLAQPSLLSPTTPLTLPKPSTDPRPRPPGHNIPNDPSPMDTVDAGTSAPTIAPTDQPTPPSELPKGPGCEQSGVAGSTQASKLDGGCGGSDEVSMQANEAEARESGGSPAVPGFTVASPTVLWATPAGEVDPAETGWPMEGMEAVRPGPFSD